jgi:hypothetical protein
MVRKDNTVPWRNSKAKALLMQDLRCGIISLDRTMTACEVVASREEYGGCGMDNLKKFAPRLQRARKVVKEGKARAAADKAMIMKHIKMCQTRKTLNGKDERMWCGSNASKQLTIDVSKGLHIEMKPQELQNTCAEYKEFSLKCFRHHIYQEVRADKFRNYCKSKKTDL